jgi:hypothetical protein
MNLKEASMDSPLRSGSDSSAQRQALTVQKATICSLGASLLLALICAVQGYAQFNDATVPPLDDPNVSTGVSWPDFDNDGDIDLYITNIVGECRLFRNDGASGFVECEGVEVLEDPDSTGSCTWADYDNDGDLDLYLAKADMTSPADPAERCNRLIRNDGDGLFVDVTASCGAAADTGVTYQATWADYDNDGHVDLFISNCWLPAYNYPPSKLVRNNGNGVFEDVTPSVLQEPQIAFMPSWADYDNDGDQDFYLTTGVWVQNEPNRLFRNNGNGVFEDVAQGTILENVGEGIGAAWADYDGDLDLDLYVTGWTPNESRLFRNNGTLGFEDRTPPVFPTTYCSGLNWADYDLDGDPDLYVARWGANQLLRNEGDGNFVNATHYPINNADNAGGLAWGDYDGDGDPDLYVANEGQPNKLFRNDYTLGNHWLQLELVGTESNRSAIGARIRMQAAGSSQIREIEGGAGKYSQNSMAAEFGLGSTTAVDFITVRWPSGQIDSCAFPAFLDQRLIWSEGESCPVPYPATAIQTVAGAPLGLRLRQNYPNPFNPTTRIVFELPHAGHVTLQIYDVGGHVVRTLANGNLEADTHEIEWDGRDSDGRRLGSGVFLYRLNADGRTLARKLVMLE